MIDRKFPNLSRRTFLLTGTAATGGLIVGIGGLTLGGETASAASADVVAMNAWISFAPTGRIVINIPRAEMGQGVYTSLSQLIAEELEISLDQVDIEQPQMDGAYANYVVALGDDDGSGVVWHWAAEIVLSMIPYIGTGGSTSVRDAWDRLREAGATAREMLRSAAAATWDVPASECTCANGTVTHTPSGRTLSYGDLAEKAADQSPPSDVVLKPRAEWKIIGKPVARLDIPEKVNGTAKFGIDTLGDGLLFATVLHCPRLGGRISRFDADSVKDMPGVSGVHEVAGGVAVVADNYWNARQAADALDFEIEGGDAKLSSEGIIATLTASLDGEADKVWVEEGDAITRLDASANTLEATYTAPYLAHACMEPLNATVLYENGKGTVWTGNQSTTVAVWATAEGLDIDTDDVTVHITYLGGGFGRRAEKDFVLQAAQVAKHYPGRPVKLLWSREEDIRADTFRPASATRFKAALDQTGNVTAWHHRAATQSVAQSFGDRVMPWGGGDGLSDEAVIEGGLHQPYRLGHQLVDYVHHAFPVPVGNWRSVGHSQNAFFIESFIDELAHAAQRDPFEYRQALLADSPRFAAVLERAATIAQWGRNLGPNRAQGIAIHKSFGSICAQVADIHLDPENGLRVERVACAIDAGMIVNPNTIAAQMESGIIYGLTAALFGEITIEDGEIVESNFPDYEMIRLANAPEVQVEIIESTERPGGVGEPATPPIAPAVANALFRLTDTRTRQLPLMHAVDIWT